MFIQKERCQQGKGNAAVSRRYRRFGFFFALLSCALTTSCASAQELHKGLREFELKMGYTRNILGRNDDLELVNVLPTYGVFRSARTELLLEGTYFDARTPDSGTGIGAMGIVRYHLREDGKIIPFVQAGVGALYTDLDIRELNGSFQFQLQTGVGVRFFLGRRTSLNAEARFYHVSNAETKQPNIGVNASQYMVGVSRFF